MLATCVGVLGPTARICLIILRSGGLSLGYVLELIVALLKDVESFFCKESSLVLKFSFTKWILKLTYISLTFDEIKKPNVWCKALIRR